MRKLLKPIFISVICLFGAAFLVCSTLRVYDRIGRMPFYDLKYTDVAKITRIDNTRSDEYEVTDSKDRSRVWLFLNSLHVGLEAKNPESFFGGSENPDYKVELINGGEINFHIGANGELRSGDPRSFIQYILIDGKLYNSYDYGLILWFSEFDRDLAARHEQDTQPEPIT